MSQEQSGHRTHITEERFEPATCEYCADEVGTRTIPPAAGGRVVKVFDASA